MSALCDEMEKFGKALGNAARYTIIQSLLNGRKTVGELVDIVKLSQPAVSQHLKTLKAAGLVVDERRGQEVFYSVDSTHLFSLLHKLSRDITKPRKALKA